MVQAEGKSQNIRLGGRVSKVQSPEFLARNRFFEEQFRSFLSGVSETEDYSPANWNHYPNGSLWRPDIDVVLENVKTGCLVEISDEGRKISLYSEQSHIPNVVGHFQTEGVEYAIKMGHVRALTANIQALQLLKNQGISSVQPALLRYKDTRVGMMISPFVNGFRPQDFTDVLDDVKSIVRAQIRMWYNSAIYTKPRQRTTGVLAYDIIPHNVFVCGGRLVCFDADPIKCWGKHIKDGELVGDVSYVIFSELEESGILPQVLGLKYNQGQLELEYPKEWAL